MSVPLSPDTSDERVHEPPVGRLPVPALEPTTAGYWLAAGEGRLVIQRCGSCGTHRHPPTEACYVCQSLDWSWDEVAGSGQVYTYTWADRVVAPELAHLGVYNMAVVELEGTQGEPVRIMSRVIDVARDDLYVGLAVEVAFEPVADHVALPVFRPRA